MAVGNEAKPAAGRLKQFAIKAAVPPFVLGKLYLGERYLAWRRRQKALKRGVGIDRREFSKLPRERQQSILAYRRAQQRDLEGIYQAGYAPRGSGRPQKRARFGFGL